MSMNAKKWLIDSDLLIEGERGNPQMLDWLEAVENVATSDIACTEFLVGAYQSAHPEKRERAFQFYRESISTCPNESHVFEDFENAARLLGEAWRDKKGKPSLADALMAATAIRTGRTVATRNVQDFKACGVPVENPLV